LGKTVEEENRGGPIIVLCLAVCICLGYWYTAADSIGTEGVEPV